MEIFLCDPESIISHMKYGEGVLKFSCDGDDISLMGTVKTMKNEVLDHDDQCVLDNRFRQ